MRITNQPITPPMAQIITVSRLMGMSSASTRLVRKRRTTPSMALMMSLPIQSPLGISSCYPRRESVVAPGQDVALRPFQLPSFTGLPRKGFFSENRASDNLCSLKLRGMKGAGLLEIPAQYARWSVILNELPRELGFSISFVAYNAFVA